MSGVKTSRRTTNVEFKISFSDRKQSNKRYRDKNYFALRNTHEYKPLTSVCNGRVCCIRFILKFSAHKSYRYARSVYARGTLEYTHFSKRDRYLVRDELIVLGRANTLSSVGRLRINLLVVVVLFSIIRFRVSR